MIDERVNCKESDKASIQARNLYYCSPDVQARQDNSSSEAFGQLVLLSFVISDFTPAAYQRHSL